MPSAGAVEAEHGLHRFQHDHDLASRHRHAWFGKHLGDLAGDWRDQPASRVVIIAGRGNRVRQAEAVRVAAMTHDDRFGLARCEQPHARTIEGHIQPTISRTLYRRVAGPIVDGEAPRGARALNADRARVSI